MPQSINLGRIYAYETIRNNIESAEESNMKRCWLEWSSSRPRSVMHTWGVDHDVKQIRAYLEEIGDGVQDVAHSQHHDKLLHRQLLILIKIGHLIYSKQICKRIPRRFTQFSHTCRSAACSLTADDFVGTGRTRIHSFYVSDANAFSKNVETDPYSCLCSPLTLNRALTSSCERLTLKAFIAADISPTSICPLLSMSLSSKIRRISCITGKPNDEGGGVMWGNDLEDTRQYSRTRFSRESASNRR